jgi:hypothetical protein
MYEKSPSQHANVASILKGDAGELTGEVADSAARLSVQTEASQRFPSFG